MNGKAGFSAGGHEVIDLDRAQALGLLASTDYGRIVFSRAALPAIRPVNHLVDGDEIIVCALVISPSETRCPYATSEP
nr:pyridoxamine 5'-phosphate oxidase family protein [Nocardia sp. BMG51109]